MGASDPEVVESDPERFTAEGILTVRDVDVIDPAGRHHKRLTTDAFVESGAAWSPDGKAVVFTDGLRSLGLLTVDSGRVRLLPARGAADDLAWSPDGRRIAYSSRGHIYITTVAGGQTRRLT